MSDILIECVPNFSEGRDNDILKQITDEIEVVVQVNGKVRSKITVSADATKEVVEENALKDKKVIEWTTGKVVKKVIYVPGKLVSIVVAG